MDTPEYSDEFAKAIITSLTNKAIGLVFKKKKKSETADIVPKDNSFGNVIGNHFGKMCNWSNNIEFIGLGKPLKTDEKSVELDLTFNVRKLTDQSARMASFDSKKLIEDHSSFLILGDPGSGKSTMMKRLLKRYFFSENPLECSYSYPLLVKFRDIKEHQNLFVYIADTLGIGYEYKEIKYSVKVERKTPKLDENGRHMSRTEERTYVKAVIKHQVLLYNTVISDEARSRYEYFINGVRIQSVITRLLDDNKVILFMDGLDEVNYLISKEIEEQVTALASGCLNAKVLVTCRPDYLERSFSEFNICQICDLEYDQKEKIAELWLDKTEAFMTSLKKKSYYELSGRPLFLGFLLFLYKDKRVLPATSQEVYRRIINLLVEKWDKDRDIKRQPAFEGFDPLKMVDFLSHLSYNLLHVDKVASFTDTDLQRAYQRIKDRFLLEEENARIICNEIENHTGLMHKVYHDKYEFSHLYLQEYLCASYLVSASSNIRKLITCLKNSPASVAMAISLSPASSEMLADIIFQFFDAENVNVFEGDRSYTTKVAKIVFRKLLIETPYFDVNKGLGIALMLLCRIANCNDEEFIQMLTEFMKQDNVRYSVDVAMVNYSYLNIDRKENQVNFSWTGQYSKEDWISEAKFAMSASLPMSIGVSYVGDEVRKFFGI